MKYKVHRVDISSGNMQTALDQFLNTLTGEVVSVIPNVTTHFLFYGAKIDYLLIVEKVG